MSVTLFALMPDGAHDVALSTTIINGIPHGFAVDGQAFVDCSVLSVPLLECSIQFGGINSNQYITYGTFTGNAVFSMTEITAKSGASSGRFGLCPVGNGLIATHPAQHCTSGDGKVLRKSPDNFSGGLILYRLVPVISD